jgi:hypothetical protein
MGTSTGTVSGSDSEDIADADHVDTDVAKNDVSEDTAGFDTTTRS